MPYVQCPHCKEGAKDCMLIGGYEPVTVEYDPAFSDCDCDLNDDEIQELFIATLKTLAEDCEPSIPDD